MTRRWDSRMAVRVGTLLFPLAGLILLWRSSNFSRARKFFATVGILLFTPVWCAAVIALLHAVGGLQVEFRGGMVPALTFRKTAPDYAALEASRARQRFQSVAAFRNATNSTASMWNGFRSARRDTCPPT